MHVLNSRRQQNVNILLALCTGFNDLVIMIVKRRACPLDTDTRRLSPLHSACENDRIVARWASEKTLGTVISLEILYN